jgi:hypothetical protein
MQECDKNNDWYAALQNGDECFCGKVIGVPASTYPKVSDTECIKNGKKVGDDNRNAVYVWGKEPFTAKLSSKHGVPARTYTFQIVRDGKSGGTFNDNYVAACAKRGMRPICDHRNYCGPHSRRRMDARSLYIGQDHHIAHGNHLKHNHYYPSGFSGIKNKFNSVCAFTDHHGGENRELCASGNGHFWASWKPNRWAMACGKVKRPPPKYIGCYSDDQVRDMKHGPKMKGFSPQECATKCELDGCTLLCRKMVIVAVTTLMVHLLPSIRRNRIQIVMLVELLWVV